MRTRAANPWADVVNETVAVPGLNIALLRPRDSMALLDEEAFDREEYLPYWADLWPASIVLAEAVATAGLHGLRVAELGCGLGLPSIAAGLRGAEVLATDWSPDAVAFTRANARRNSSPLRAQVCSWEQPQTLVAAGPWDLVIASDVLYEPRNGPQLQQLLPHLAGLATQVWIADPGRPHTERFLNDASRDWRVESVPDAQRPWVTLHRLHRGSSAA